MYATETHFLDNGYVFNIPPVPYRRRIAVPLLLAVAKGGKSRAKHKVIFNGVNVAEAAAAGIVIPGAPSMGNTGTNSWNGYIQANESVSIQGVGETNDGGQTPKCITVLIGAE
ncbi:hypothetical protein [Serratia marcescens]|uniref:hypothetical protein n=1 Tax=Serratia marcescens TaxID=615 RepID=UPI003EE193CA